MFRHRVDQSPNPSVIFHWFLLSFNGGFINAGGFLATGKFVSHVTGFATLFGVELAVHHVLTALSLLTVPIFFLLGAFASGILVEYPLQQGKRPHYDYIMIASCLCICVSAQAEFFHIGHFGEVFRVGASFFLLALLCLASGLQNGAITSSSLRSVRTTHLTGITTDLGLGLARVFTMDRNHESYENEVRSNQLRIGSIVSFVLGSAVGAYGFHRLGYIGFYIPAAITIYAAWQGRAAKKTIDPTDVS